MVDEEKKETDKDKIDNGEWADCWVCRDIFARRRQTMRYCEHCKRAFCEGEHGNFSHRVGSCIVCSAR